MVFKEICKAFINGAEKGAVYGIIIVSIMDLINRYILK